MTISKAVTTVIGVALLSLALWGCGGDRGDNMPVILITVDGLAADQLSLFGGPKETPALATLADSGVVYEDVWSSSPMTRPAVATYLTGLAPDRHGIRDEFYATLPETIPTLAFLLSEKGYSTAAFPNSSFLGYASGLLTAFETVDDPPALPIGPEKNLPLARAADSSAQNFKLWLEAMPPDTDYFGWLHFSGPLLDQMDESFTPGTLGMGTKGKGKGKAQARRQERIEAMKGKGAQSEESGGSQGDAKPMVKRKGKGVPPDAGRAIEAFDAALGSIIEAIKSRGELESTLVIVVATGADIGGGSSDARGPGFSLDERAVNVPLIVRFPAGSGRPRAEEEIVWAPDIAATIAQLAGAELSAEAEGISLLEQIDDDRIVYSWSWATLDQMGWLPLRAARQGNVKLLQGVEERLVALSGDEIDEAVADRLRLAISERAELDPAVLDLTLVAPWLEGRGIKLDPLPTGGRVVLDLDKRRKASDFLWKGRMALSRRRHQRVVINYDTAHAADPDSFGPLFELGQSHALDWSDQREARMTTVVEKYPYSPDALHWYLHAIWQESWAEAEEMVDLLLAHRPQDMDLLYDKACARSLDGDIRLSIEFLETAIQAGYERWDIIQSDRDLRNLRESPDFSELLKHYGR